MPDEPVETHLAVETVPDVASSLEQCLSLGFRSSSTDEKTAWTVRTEETKSSDLSTASAIAELQSAQWGWIGGWIGQVPVRIGFCLDSRLVPPDTTTVSLSTSELYLRPDSPNADENIRRYLDLVSTLYEQLDTWYGVGSYLHAGVGDEALRFDSEAVRNGSAKDLYWLNLYSPELVSHLGRSALSSAPAAQTRNLADGGVMVLSVLYPYEFGPLDDDSVAVADHLGLEIASTG